MPAPAPAMNTEDLDFVLVPVGLAILLGYHGWLLYCILHRPTKTVIGINAVNRRRWVFAIIADPIKNGVLGVQAMRNNIMASQLLASTAIMLTAIMAAIMSSNSGTQAFRDQALVVGNRSQAALFVKFFSIVFCYMVAFLLTVESVRYYSHASILLSVPYSGELSKYMPEYVAGVVNKGSYFWSLGLHCYYVSLPVFLWLFGPIPMAASSVLLVAFLYFLDMASGYSTVLEVNTGGTTTTTTTEDVEKKAAEDDTAGSTYSTPCYQISSHTL